MFCLQYADSGISRYPSISIRETYGYRYVGESEEYDVYTYQLAIPYFEDIEASANQHAIDDIIGKEINVSDMIKVLKKDRSEERETYMGENYKIVLEDNICVIAPLESSPDVKEIVIGK